MNSLYSKFNTYFDAPVLTKLRDTESHSMYVAQVRSLVSVKRYLFVLAPKDVYFIGSEVPLSKLKWTSLQTRTSETTHRCVTITYTPKHTPAFKDPIQLSNKSNDAFTYTCPTMPLQITLLKNETDMFDYPASGNVAAALETYNTIVNVI